ncbi:hypothetical protein J7K18_04075 [bacterium]|nr:hypothetical protein [bacterium]
MRRVLILTEDFKVKKVTDRYPDMSKFSVVGICQRFVQWDTNIPHWGLKLDLAIPIEKGFDIINYLEKQETNIPVILLVPKGKKKKKVWKRYLYYELKPSKERK